MVDPPYKDVASKVWGVSKKVEGVTKKVGGVRTPPTPQWLRPCRSVSAAGSIIMGRGGGISTPPAGILYHTTSICTFTSLIPAPRPMIICAVTDYRVSHVNAHPAEPSDLKLFQNVTCLFGCCLMSVSIVALSSGRMLTAAQIVICSTSRTGSRDYNATRRRTRRY